MSAGRCLRRLQKTNTVPSSLINRRCTTPTLIISCANPPSAKRHFICTPTQLYASVNESSRLPSHSEDVSASHEQFDSALEEELLAIQDAAIAKLEADLGKSLEQAIEDGQLAGGIVDANHSGSHEEIDETVAEYGERSPAAIQEKQECAVREARNKFGDHLPPNVLSKDEFTLYRRLYGDPLPETNEGGEQTHARTGEVDESEAQENVLYGADGQEIPYYFDSATEIEIKTQARDNKDNHSSAFVNQQPSSEAFSEIQTIAQAVQGDVVDEETYRYEEEDEDLDTEDARSHPLTKLGKFATYPRTTFFSKETFVRPVEDVMSNFSNKQLREMCERTFGGPGLPDSPLTPKSGRSRPQVPIPLDASQNVMGQMEANAFMASVMPPTYASILAVLTETRKRLGVSWLNRLLAKPGGPRILDAGSAGVGILAWRDVVNAHWDSLHSSDKNTPPPPESKSVVLAGSDTLRHRAIKMLDNTTFIPRLPDYMQTRQTPTLDDDRPAQQRKQFDLIVASHSLFALKEEWERKMHVQNLWSLLNEDGGVLVIIEKGIPRGFETVAAAREILLERYITTPEGHNSLRSITATAINAPDNEVYQKSPGMIVAPCTNHTKCPLYRTPGLSRGRKDVCSFQQRYVRPPFLQRILGAKDRNHDDVDFSYISVMKGEDLRTRSYSTWEHIIDPLSAPPATSPAAASDLQNSAINDIQSGFEDTDPMSANDPAPPPTHTLPRIINQPLKRQAHVTMDLCTPTGEIRRWTIPKSFSRQAYRDARKARWGDLWALGAKTNIPRNLKTGVSDKDFQANGGKMSGTMGQPRSRKERLEMQAERILEAEEVAKSEEEAEEQELMRMIEEDDLLDEPDDAVDELIDMDTLTPKSASASTTATTGPGRRKQNHSKLHNINIFGKSAAPKSATSPRSAASPSSSFQPLSKPNTNTANTSNSDFIQVQDLTPGRYGDEEHDNLASWSDELEGAMIEDEARRQLSKSGRRPTTKNTYKLKKELRRLRRESLAASGGIGA